MSSSGGDSSYGPPTVEETGGLIPFAGNLDPYAQEFRPTYPSPPYSAPFLLLPHYYCLYNPPPPPYPLGGAAPASYVSAPNQLLLPPPSSTATRSLLLSSLPTDVSESTVRRDLEVFGDLRAVQMERVRREGIVAVHFYDLRASHAALAAICEQQHRLRVHYSGLMMMAAPGAAAGHGLGNVAEFKVVPAPPLAPGIFGGRGVWAQFMVPANNAFPDGHNQGSLVVFNLDPQISPSTFSQLFEPYGPVKEFRGTPMKSNRRFVEFYDVRDAGRALSAMNGKEINGRVVMIEFSRPSGRAKRSSFSSCSSSSSSSLISRDHRHQYGIHKYYTLSGSRRNIYPSPPPPSSCSRGRSPWRSNVMANLPPRVKGWFSSSFSSRRSSGVGRRENSNSSDGSSTTVGFSVEGAMCGLTLCDGGDQEEAKEQGKNNSDDDDCGGSVAVEQPDQIVGEVEDEVVRCMEVPVTTRVKSTGRGTKGRKKFDPRFLIKEEAIGVEPSRSCSTSSYCSDSRTTVMIKNIPNKYSQKLLLNMLDSHCIHCNEQILAGADDDGDHHVDPSTPLSSYDFLYLPIDFSNKCNVGYGFVNMTSPAATLRLYKAFHKQHWEVFNSRKTCELTYARVQGLEALKEHFKNSKFACETEEYLPVAFSPPRDGERNLTRPLPIVPHYKPTTTTGCSSVDHREEGADDGTDGGDRGSTNTHYHHYHHHRELLLLQKATRGDSDDNDAGGDHNNERDDDGGPCMMEQEDAVGE